MALLSGMCAERMLARGLLSIQTGLGLEPLAAFGDEGHKGSWNDKPHSGKFDKLVKGQFWRCVEYN